MANDSPGPKSPPPDSNVPDNIGPYRLERRLGTGGMGEVYLAFDGRLHRRVAIKHIRTDIERDPTHRARLQREARAVAQLSHPSIVQIFDFVETDDGDWVVMELIDGPSVTDLLRRGPLDVSQVLTIARQVAEGLAEAHDKGILHRDLKTENVMLTQGDQAKILDFGLAKVEVMNPSDSTLTRVGEVMGTCRSMSPEQAKGSKLDGRSDLFALGVLMYEMLTNVSPFQGANPVSTLTRVCTMKHRPIWKRAPNVPKIVSELVDHLLEKDRDRRPSDARAAAQTLQAVSRQLGFESAEIAWPNVDTGWRPSEEALEATGSVVTWPQPTSSQWRRQWQRGLWRRRRGWLLAAAAMILSLAAIWWQQQSPAGPSMTEPRPAVAVLGLVDLTADADHGWLTTAFAELLHNRLADDRVRVMPMDLVARIRRELPPLDGETRATEQLVQAAALYGSQHSISGVVEPTDTADELQWKIFLQPENGDEASTAISVVAIPRDVDRAADLVAKQLRSQLGLPAVEENLESRQRSALPGDLAALRHYALGLDLLRQQEFDAAKLELQKAVADEPESAVVWSALSHVSESLGLESEALNAAARAAELAELLPAGIRGPIVARHYELADRPTEAIATYRSLHNEFADQLEYGLDLAAALIRHGKPEPGLELSQALRQQNGSDARIDLLEAEAALALANEELALAACQKVVETSKPGQKWLRARGLLLQARALLNQQQPTRAAAAAARARSLFAELGDGVEESRALDLLRMIDQQSTL